MRRLFFARRAYSMHFTRRVEKTFIPIKTHKTFPTKATSPDALKQVINRLITRPIPAPKTLHTQTHKLIPRNLGTRKNPTHTLFLSRTFPAKNSSLQSSSRAVDSSLALTYLPFFSPLPPPDFRNLDEGRDTKVEPR